MADTATIEEVQTTEQNATDHLPPYEVWLQNDDINEIGDVIKKVQRIVGLSFEEATHKAIDAHNNGEALLLVTHKERAELIQEQFASFVPPIGIEIRRAE